MQLCLRHTYLLFGLLLLLACRPEESFIEPLPIDEPEEEAPIETDGEGYRRVDEVLWAYWASFEEEAALRGKTVDLKLSGIEGDIEALPEEGVAGQCSYGYVAGKRIVIDREFWDRANTNWRELVVFHELGHCYLERGHREEAFDNGLCKSIMRSGTEDCRDAYGPQNREYYLNELFEDGHPGL